MAVVAKLVISLDDAGRVNVEGPIENKLFVYGLLELGKEAIKQYHDEAEKRVKPATAAERLAIVGGNGRVS
jgi:hypothetical protein